MENNFQISLEINFQSWDKFCLANNGNVFQSPYFYRICQLAREYTPHPLFAMQNGQIMASLLPVEVRFMPRILDTFTNRIILYGGILSTANDAGNQAVDAVFRHLLNNVKLPPYLFLEIRNFAPAEKLRLVLEPLGVEYFDYINYTIDLTQPADALWSAVNSRRRSYIRKADRLNLRLRTADSPADVRTFYNILKDVYKKKGVPLADISLFLSPFLKEEFREVYQILLLELNGEIIAGMALLMYNGTGYEWYVGSRDEYHHLHPNEWMIWEVLKMLKENGFHTFDFCGAGKPDEDYGVRIFKKRFGGAEHNFGRFIYIPSPWKFKMLNKIYQLKQAAGS